MLKLCCVVLGVLAISWQPGCSRKREVEVIRRTPEQQLEIMRNRTTDVRLRRLRIVINTYRKQHGKLPKSMRALLTSGPVKLRPFDLLDGWESRIHYALGKSTFRLCSAGADRRLRTSDDICK